MNGIVVSVNLPSNQLYEENFMCVILPCSGYSAVLSPHVIQLGSVSRMQLNTATNRHI